MQVDPPSAAPPEPRSATESSQNPDTNVKSFFHNKNVKSFSGRPIIKRAGSERVRMPELLRKTRYK